MRALLMALALAMAAAPGVANAWWQKDWAYRKQVTVEPGAGAGAIGAAPVLVRLHSGVFNFEDAQANGADIRFVGGDDKTPLPFQIESYDAQTGVAAIWVGMAGLAPGQKQQIWMYYGAKDAPKAADAATAFDADYVMVHHFADAAGAPPKDATAYRNNGQAALAAINPAAVIGKGAKFAGVPMVVPASASTAVAGGGPFTFSAWVKEEAPSADAAIYARPEAAGALVVGLANGAPYVQAGAARVQAATPVTAGQWAHVAAVADGQNITLYVNGAPAGTAPAVLPALAGPTSIGGDAAAPFAGELDEVRVSKIARPAGLIALDAAAQGPTGKAVSFGEDEEQGSGHAGYFGVIIKSVTVDAWVVIGILAVMAALSWWIMWSKASYANRADKANDRFLEVFRKAGGDPIHLLDRPEEVKSMGLADSTLFRLYTAGAEEIRRRDTLEGRKPLDAGAIGVMRALIDATLVRENQKLAAGMVVLTIAISGGPFLGLLGTVVGVMITFAAIAASGDVNINAIAPGISAALLATVAGLAVAIPALFAYNYLLIRNKNITSNMQVFVDEFIARVVETHRAHGFSHAAE